MRVNACEGAGYVVTDRTKLSESGLMPSIRNDVCCVQALLLCVCLGVFDNRSSTNTRSISSTHTNSHMKTHVRKKDALSRMHAHICALKCTADTQSLPARPPL